MKSMRVFEVQTREGKTCLMTFNASEDRTNERIVQDLTAALEVFTAFYIGIYHGVIAAGTLWADL